MSLAEVPASVKFDVLLLLPNRPTKLLLKSTYLLSGVKLNAGDVKE